MTIKELRRATGMTQAKFAEYFEIPKSSMEKWEYRVTKPPAYLIKLIEYRLKKENLI